MDIQFVDNRKINHEKYLHNVLKAKGDIVILVAFLKWSGLKEFKNKIENLIEKGSSLTFFVGLDFYISEPKAILKLYEIISINKNSKLFLIQGKRNTFHPKVYCGVTGV